MGKIRDFFHPRQAAARFYAEQEEELSAYPEVLRVTSL
jgi:hypothetical protein